MNEADRIRAMRDEGKIDDAQAERLLAAVEAIAAAEQETAEAHEAAAANEAGSEPRDRTSAAVGATAAAAAAAGTAAGTASTPTQRPTTSPAAPTEPAATIPDVDLTTVVDRWLDLDLFAGSLDVKVDPAITAPRASSSGGDVSVEESADGWAIARSGEQGGTWLERLVNGVNESRIHISVPPRTGVRMNVKAGDVDLAGIPALSGRLMAGDLDATGLRAVDLNVKAGDIDLDLDPLPGRHAVFLAAGDLTVTLPEHADASVHGSVKVGDASASAPLRSERRGMIAGQVSGVLGDGRARIELTVGTGDLDVERSHHRGS